MIQLGRYELHAINTGGFRLDGGSMFGVVPRVLWAPRCPPDDLNRIELVSRSLLAIDRAAGRVILVDCGLGDKWDAGHRERFALSIEGDPLHAGLCGCGVAEEDITDVIVTHLHFDHNAGLTRLNADGQTVPRFPAARHWVHRDHLAHALAPTPKDRGSFMAPDFEPLRVAGLFSELTHSTPASTFDDVEWLVAHGHTAFQLLPRFIGDGTGVQFLADLIPTAAHLPVPWVMAYDNHPLQTVSEKQLLYEACAASDTILFFQHDPHVVAGRLSFFGKNPRICEHIAV